MQKPVLDRLTLKRSQPVQGQRVDAEVFWNDQPVGRLELPFSAWLKVKRLLEKGLEMDAREDHGLQLKLSIQGGVAPSGVALPSEAAARQSLEDFAEDPEDADDLAAIAAAEAGSLPPTMPSISPEEHAEEEKHEVTQGLIRSLRRENADG